MSTQYWSLSLSLGFFSVQVLPPTRSRASSTRDDRPFFFNSFAADSPARPAPTITTSTFSIFDLSFFSISNLFYNCFCQWCYLPIVTQTICPYSVIYTICCRKEIPLLKIGYIFSVSLNLFVAHFLTFHISSMLFLQLVILIVTQFIRLYSVI